MKHTQKKEELSGLIKNGCFDSGEIICYKGYIFHIIRKASSGYYFDYASHRDCEIHQKKEEKEKVYNEFLSVWKESTP